MADVMVRTMELELRTAKLNKSILRQMKVEHDFHKIRPYLADDETKKAVIGWVHGSVIESGEDYHRWLIINVAPGDYVRFKAMPETAEKFKQIYVI